MLDASRDEIYKQISNLNHERQVIIIDYLKVLDDTLYNAKGVFQNGISSNLNLADILDTMRKKALLLELSVSNSSVNNK